MVSELQSVSEYGLETKCICSHCYWELILGLIGTKQGKNMYLHCLLPLNPPSPIDVLGKELLV